MKHERARAAKKMAAVDDEWALVLGRRSVNMKQKKTFKKSNCDEGPIFERETFFFQPPGIESVTILCVPLAAFDSII